jgi:hypothetical protein
MVLGLQHVWVQLASLKQASMFWQRVSPYIARCIAPSKVAGAQHLARGPVIRLIGGIDRR